MEQERDKAWEAEDERFVVDDPDNGPAGDQPAVPAVSVPLEAPEADVVEQHLPVPDDDEER